MNLFELKTPPVHVPVIADVMRTLRSSKKVLIGSENPAAALNVALAPYNISFQYIDAADSRVPAHDDVGVIRAETNSDGRIMVDMERDLSEVFVDDDLWAEFLGVMEEVIGHEMIHRSQFKAIRAGKDTFTQTPDTGDKRADYKAYLATKHEMMAYAYQAVTELKNDGFAKPAIAKLLKDPYNPLPRIEDSAMMSRYAKYFTVDSPEFRRFVSYMEGYLANLDF